MVQTARNNPLRPRTDSSSSSTSTTTTGTSLYSDQQANSRNLLGSQVLELTRFAHKKVWIDDKIKFLSSLPKIDVVSPLPPIRSSTTLQQLERWWSEHDRIEEEVQQYDIGDLAHLKAFAKEASKKELSPRDTDLIEITLTTLFAIDKLLHLLRGRRKALTLLGYRLQWENQVEQSWSLHQSILSDLPTFLSKARWSIPPSSTSPLSSLSGPSSPTTTTNSSSSSSTIPTGSPSHHPSSSNLSRSLRIDTLNSSFTTLSQRITLLSKTILPSSSNSLDLLIDHSSKPLPDRFLDEQDRLEDRTKIDLNDLEEFLKGMKEQWETGDRFWCLFDRFMNDIGVVQERIGQRPRQEEELIDLDDKIRVLKQGFGEAKRRVGQEIEYPIHPSAWDQNDENKRLSRTFERIVKKVGDDLNEVEKSFNSWKFAVKVEEKSRVVGIEIDRILERIDRFLQEDRELVGRPVLDDPRCLKLDSNAFELKEFVLANQIKIEALDQVPILLQDSSSIIVDLGKSSSLLEASVRKDLRNRFDTLRDKSKTVEQVFIEAKLRKDRLEAAQRLTNATNECEDIVSNAITSLLTLADQAKWTLSSMASNPNAAEMISEILAKVDQSIQDRIPSPFEKATALLAGPQPKLHDHLAKLVEGLHERSDALKRLGQHVEMIDRQRIEVEKLLQEVELIDQSVEGMHVLVEQSMDSTSSDELASVIERTRKNFGELDSSLLVLSDETHRRIPFLSSVAPTSPNRFEAEGQDELVRRTLNDKISRSRARVEQGQNRVEELDYRRQALLWDQEQEQVSKRINTIEDGAREVREQIDRRNEDGEATLAAFSGSLMHLTEEHRLILPVLDALTASHSALSSVQHIEERSPTLDSLSSRHSMISRSLDDSKIKLEAIAKIKRAREAADHQASLDAAAALIASRHSKLMEDAIRLRTEANELLLEAETDETRIEAWNGTMVEERDRLLQAKDLNESSDVDVGIATAAQEQFKEVRERLLLLRNQSEELLEQVVRECKDHKSDDLISAQSASKELSAKLEEVDSSLTMAQEHLRTAKDHDRSWIVSRAAALNLRARRGQLLDRLTAISHALEDDEAKSTNTASTLEFALMDLQTRRAALSSARQQLLTSTDFNNAALVSPALDTTLPQDTVVQARQSLHDLGSRVQSYLTDSNAIVAELKSLVDNTAAPIPVSARARVELLHSQLESTSGVMSTLEGEVRAVKEDERDWGERRAARLDQLRAAKQEAEAANLEREKRLAGWASKIGSLNVALDALFSDLHVQRKGIDEIDGRMDSEDLEGSARKIRSAIEALVNTEMLDDSSSALSAVASERNVMLEAAINLEQRSALEDRLISLDARIRECRELLREVSDYSTKQVFNLKSQLDFVAEARTAEDARLLEKAHLAEATRRAKALQLEEEARLQNLAGNKHARSAVDSNGGDTSLAAQNRASLNRSIIDDGVVAASLPLGADGLPLAAHDASLNSTQSAHRRVNSRALPFTAPQDLVDVFGSKSSSISFEFGEIPDEASEVTTLRAHINAIHVEDWLNPRLVFHLPKTIEADRLAGQVRRATEEIEAIESDPNGAAVWADLEPMKVELRQKIEASRRVQALARFGDRVSAADKSLSSLLNAIDSVTMNDSDMDDGVSVASCVPESVKTTVQALSIPEALRIAGESVTDVRKHAIPLIDDSRVTKDVERLEVTYSEMTSMAMEIEHNAPSVRSSNDDVFLVPRSAPNRSRPTSAMSNSSNYSTASTASASRRTSTAPIQKTPTRSLRRPSTMVDPDATPRRRPLTSMAISPTPPTPLPSLSRDVPVFGSRLSSRAAARSVSSMSSNRVDDSRRATLGSTTPARRSSLALTTGTQGGRSFSAASTRLTSTASSVSQQVTPRRASRAATRAPPSAMFDTPSREKRQYQPNPLRKVDVEVGRIVNELDLHVPIRPAEDAHGSDSGQYWIGDAETGRYYFCRILRSKTVMVRVGGGWENLHHFIVARFGTTSIVNLSPQISPSTAVSPATNEPQPWIRGGGSRQSSDRSSHTPSRANNLPSERRLLSPRLSTSSSLSNSSSTSSLLSISTSSFSSYSYDLVSTSRSRRSSSNSALGLGLGLAPSSPNIGIPSSRRTSLVVPRPSSRNALTSPRLGSNTLLSPRMGTRTSSQSLDKIRSPWRP